MTVTKNKLNVTMTVTGGLARWLSNKSNSDKFTKEILTGLSDFFIGKDQNAIGDRSILGSHFIDGNASKYKYPPLSPAYNRRKIAKFGKKPMLVATGELKNKAMDAQVKIKNNKSHISSKSPPPYAKFIESGTDKMPKRPVWTINTNDKKTLTTRFHEITKLMFGDLVKITTKVERVV